MYMYIVQVGLQLEVASQSEPQPTGQEEQAEVAEGEEPVATRPSTNGDIEAGMYMYNRIAQLELALYRMLYCHSLLFLVLEASCP